MDESIVKHLNFENYDVLMFYDYNSLNTDFDKKEIENYSKKYLIAWSMGVMIATKFNLQINSATAINGTLKPIDEKYGIHPKIYDLTIKGFNEKGRERFIKSMFNPIPEKMPIVNRELDNQKMELIAIKEYEANISFKYNKVLISNSDKIIPTKSQVEYWLQEPNVEGGHCIFSLFNAWSELLWTKI